MIEPPKHLSSDARQYLHTPDVVDYPEDWSDPHLVQEVRDLTEALWGAANDALDFEYDVQPDTIAGVAVERVRVETTTASPAGIILHFHGGMFCLGSPVIDRVLNAPLARATGLEVVSVDYRLAPEYPYPAALDDAVSVYNAVSAEGAPIALLGESAGGGLAAACALRARDEHAVRPAAVVLISPMLDLTGGSDTYRTRTAVDIDYFDPSVLLEPAGAYAGGTALDHPLLSPVYADLSDLAPMLIQVGGREVLLGDATRFARAARQAGTAVDLHVLDGGWHNYPIWYGVPEADEALCDIARFIRTALDGEERT